MPFVVKAIANLIERLTRMKTYDRCHLKERVIVTRQLFARRDVTYRRIDFGRKLHAPPILSSSQPATVLISTLTKYRL